MKLTKILCILLVTTFLLYGCGTDTEESLKIESSIIDKESYTTNVSVTTTLEVTTYNEQDEFDKMALDFLEKLKNADSKGLGEITDTNSDGVFDFLKDIKIDNYFINSVDEIFDQDSNGNKYSKGYNYNIKFNISKSTSDIFPIGESNWILTLGPSAGSCIFGFTPIDIDINNITWKRENSAVNFCYNFTNQFYCFSSLSDFNELVPLLQDKNYYNYFIYNCAMNYKNISKSYYFPVDKLEKFMNMRYGITNIKFKEYEYYDEKNDILEPPAHGGNWLFCTLVSDEYNKNNNHHTIVIDYYADSAYLIKSKTMEYILEGNSENDFKLLSTKLIYDSGYNPGRGSIW